jgi:hypothetical protein
MPATKRIAIYRTDDVALVALVTGANRGLGREVFGNSP